MQLQETALKVPESELHVQDMAKAFTSYTDRQRYDMYMESFRFKEIELKNEQSSHSVREIDQALKELKKQLDVIPRLLWKNVNGALLHI